MTGTGNLQGSNSIFLYSQACLNSVNVFTQKQQGRRVAPGSSSNLHWYRQASRFPQCWIRLFTASGWLLMMPLVMAGFAGGVAGADRYRLP